VVASGWINTLFVGDAPSGVKLFGLWSCV